MSELGKRIAVAAVGLPLIAVLVAAGPFSTAGLLGACGAIGCWEYERLIFSAVPAAAWVGISSAAVMPLLPELLNGNLAGVVLFALLAVASMSIWVVHLFAGPRWQAPERAGHVLAGALFSSGGLVALSALRAGADGAAWVVVVLASTWANDTFAYLVGRRFGRRPFWPEVSPHKTWEGFRGECSAGLRFSVSRVPGFRTTSASEPPWRSASWPACWGRSETCVSRCSSELVTRKDSGRLLPGHGGLLDRIDGVLFVAPAVWLVRVLVFRR